MAALASGFNCGQLCRQVGLSARLPAENGTVAWQSMAKGPFQVEERLSRIAAIGDIVAIGQDEVRLIREAIGGGNNLLIRAAAKAAARRMLVEVVPDLVRAFNDLLDRPARADKGCIAKAAVAEALNVLECLDDQLFLRGVRFTQQEPSFGKTAETAGMVRAHCALALARMSHPQAARETLPLLVDAQPEARAVGVRALAYLGGEAGYLLLRLKALAGDEQPAVVGECLSALVKMDPSGSLEFVSKFLESENAAIVEEAAMALAGAQDERAARMLIKCRTSRTDTAFRDMLLVPIAMTRCDAAADALCEVIVDEPRDSALVAVKASAMHRHDPHWRDRIALAARLREDPVVLRAAETAFGTP